VRISGYEDWKIGSDGLISESLGHFDAADFQRQIQLPSANLSFKDLLELVWKAAAVFSSLCFLCGFFVVNIHSTQFGYHSLGLLNAQYLTAGVWALLPVAVGWWIVLYVTDEESKGFVAKPGVILFLICGVAITLLALGLGGHWISSLSLGLRVLIVVIAAFFTSLPTVAFFWWLTPLHSVTKREINRTFALACVACVFVVVYLLAFAHHVYPDIPGTLGGGKPRKVRLIIKPEVKKDFAAAGVVFAAESQMTECFDLLAATDKEYIVRGVGNAESLSIRSDSVQAVSYEKDDCKPSN
jgi:hypothetical protein